MSTETSETQLFKESYTPNKFVNREAEIRQIESRISQARAGAIIQPLVNFWGVPGIGKTWLLTHLHHKYKCSPDHDVCAMYHDFRKKEHPFHLKQVTEHLAQDIRHLLPDTALDSTGNFVKSLLELSNSRIFILLLDTTEDLPDDNLYELEKELLEPLLESDRVIVVIAGRQKIPRWRRVEVRRRALPANYTHIGSFSFEAFQKQLARIEVNVAQDSEQALALYTYTAGTPWLVSHIIHRLTTEDLPNAALNTLKEYENKVLESIKKYPLQSYFYAILPLRYYRIEALRDMLIAQGMHEELSDVRLLQVLRELDRDANFIWWSDRGEYTTDPAVRLTVEQRQQLEEPEKYITNHKQAINLYQKRTEKYLATSALYLIEMFYHQARLANFNGEVVTSNTPIIKQILNYARVYLTPDNRLTLYNQLLQDTELMEIIPQAVFQTTVSEIEMLLKQVEATS